MQFLVCIQCAWIHQKTHLKIHEEYPKLRKEQAGQRDILEQCVDDSCLVPGGVTRVLQSLEGFLKFLCPRRTTKAHQQMHPFFLFMVFWWHWTASFRVLTACTWSWNSGLEEKANVLSNVSVGIYLKRQKQAWLGQPAWSFSGRDLWNQPELAESRTLIVRLHFESSWTFMAWAVWGEVTVLLDDVENWTAHLEQSMAW